MRNRLLKQIRLRERLPLWSVRLILGAVLLTFSEIVMWQNPPSYSILDWIERAVLYIALAAILIDVTVRFQANEIAGLALVGGLYGLLSSSIVSHSAFAALPWSLLLRGMGLQTGAGLYGLLFFVLVMRGKQISVREIGVAAVIGVLWGIWVKWYPVQAVVGWGAVPIETATLYLIGGFVITGALILLVGPRFRVIREKDMQLLWWEWIIAGAPLFLALVVGMLDANVIPVLPLALMAVIGGFVIGALFLQRHGFEPSLLAQITFAAPNAQTYVILSVVFLVTGTVGAILTTDANSPLGVIAYFVIIAAGSLWLPAASALVGLRAYRRESKPEL